MARAAAVAFAVGRAVEGARAAAVAAAAVPAVAVAADVDRAVAVGAAGPLQAVTHANPNATLTAAILRIFSLT